MTPPKYIESTLAMRVKLVLAPLAGVLVKAAYATWVKPALEGVGSLPICEMLPWVRAELIALVAICWFGGWVLLREAQLTRRAGVTPRPGTWVWARTRVRTGFPAYLAAGACYVLAAVFFAGPPAVVVTGKFYVVFCVPEACGC